MALDPVARMISSKKKVTLEGQVDFHKKLLSKEDI